MNINKRPGKRKFFKPLSIIFLYNNNPRKYTLGRYAITILNPQYITQNGKITIPYRNLILSIIFNLTIHHPLSHPIIIYIYIFDILVCKRDY